MQASLEFYPDFAEDSPFAQLADGEQSSFGILLCDGRGLIVNCSSEGARMFGRQAADLVGCSLWSLLPGITHGSASPGYRARYMAYLSANACWRRLPAVDAGGCEFLLDLAMSKHAAAGETQFLVHLRYAVDV